jgi:hypothetical protein
MRVKFALLRPDTAEAEPVVYPVAQDNDIPGRVDPGPEHARLTSWGKMACASDSKGKWRGLKSLEALPDIG